MTPEDARRIGREWLGVGFKWEDGVLAQPGSMRVQLKGGNILDASPAGSGEVWRFRHGADGQWRNGELFGSSGIEVAHNDPIAWPPPEWPDPRDRATMGIMLGHVRDAWGKPHLYCEEWTGKIDENGHGCWVIGDGNEYGDPRPPWLDEDGCRPMFDTEAEALGAALKAARERE